jgi:monofunctional glycosyltransferase
MFPLSKSFNPRAVLGRAASVLLGDGMPARILGRAARALAALVVLGHAALAVFVLLASAVLSRANPPFTALMAWRRLTAGQAIEARLPVPLSRMPRALPDMVVRLEDFHFYGHRGIDLGAIRDAYLVNRSLGYTLYGGSTIPQQLARNLFLTPRKTYFRKYLEALIAVEMDLLLSKRRILELYLNNIEWGKGVFGVGAASHHYYGTTPARLTVDQQRRMVAILTNPLRYTVTTFPKSRQMAARYRYLVSRFADPSDAPAPTPVTEEQPGAETRQPDPEPAGPDTGQAGTEPSTTGPPTVEPAGSPGAGAGQP